MKKIAFLFPGQGSQEVGMGLDLYQEFDFVREIFDMVDEVCKTSISRLCFKGPLEDLTMTVNLQPAVTAVNLACLKAIEKEGVFPYISAGHSLGEYSALCAAKVVTEVDTCRLVLKRGSIMHRESVENPGVMHAIVGLEIDAVKKIVDQAREIGTVAVANHNTAEQIVITGDQEAVEEASRLAAAQGAKSIPLKVSGAWHSDLISRGVDEFKEILTSTPFKTPQGKIVFNVTADFESDPDRIKEIMAKQFCSPVRWYDSINRIEREGIDAFVEVGPRKVLTGLLRKILPKKHPYQIYNVDGLKGLDKFLKGVT
nr:ACP S-malonyltransferase [Desulfobacterales bacterium]